MANAIEITETNTRIVVDAAQNVPARFALKKKLRIYGVLFSECVTSGAMLMSVIGLQILSSGPASERTRDPGWTTVLVQKLDSFSDLAVPVPGSEPDLTRLSIAAEREVAKSARLTPCAHAAGATHVIPQTWDGARSLFGDNINASQPRGACSDFANHGRVGVARFR